ncbi:transcription elongation factor GreB [Ralstonia sp. GP73]|nr:transcription elongation factor GreB [Ralstonia sp. GP73]
MASSIMNKAFVREDSGDDEDDLPEGAAPLPPGSKNYITPAGYERLRTELMHLIDTERPEVVGIVSWAASNGDRSENGDYLYGKKRLREIDRRIRFLTRRIEKAEVVDASLQGDNDQIFFGATVTYANQRGEEKTITIVGMDEVDLDIGHVSWISPIARALIKARVGDTVPLRTPTGVEQIDILEVKYPPRTA